MKAILISLALLGLPLSASVTQPVCAQTETASSAEAREVREVTAEGRAAIGPVQTGGIFGARQAAIAVALRNALEKTVGVYVSGTSLTHNSQLVRDEVLTHVDGFVTLKKLISTEVENGMVRVVVRAIVSTRPLAERLKALRLTRAFRIYVQPSAGSNISDDAIESSLTDAGFFVTDKKEDADLLVQITPRFTAVQDTPLDTAAGPMTMHSVRADITLKAVRTETGERVATVKDSDTAANIAVPAARSEAAFSALGKLAPRLADALLTLPAEIAQPVELVVAGLSGVTQAATLEDALNASLPGVQKVTRRGYESGRAVYDLDMLKDSLPLLARSLETQIGLKKFNLNVTKETRNRIVVSAASSQASSR